VNRIEQVPVEVTSETEWFEDRRLDELRAAVFGDRLPLQPGAAWNLHLGPEPQQIRGLDPLDPPEIHGIARLEICRVAAAAAQPGPSHETVEQTSDRPGSRPE